MVQQRLDILEIQERVDRIEPSYAQKMLDGDYDYEKRLAFLRA